MFKFYIFYRLYLGLYKKCKKLIEANNKLYNFLLFKYITNSTQYIQKQNMTITDHQPDTNDIFK